MASVRPADEPDPDGDRRFAERPFPLLEPVGWTGERHRGGYGIADPGSRTIALELVFGARHVPGTPRIAVTVGTPEILELASDRRSIWGLHATRQVEMDVAGDSVAIDVAGRDHWWYGTGRWGELALRLEVDGVPPGELALRVTAELPPAS